MICKRYFTQCWPPTFTEALSFVAGAGVKTTYEWRMKIFGNSIEEKNVILVLMDRLMADWSQKHADIEKNNNMFLINS